MMPNCREFAASYQLLNHVKSIRRTQSNSKVIRALLPLLSCSVC